MRRLASDGDDEIDLEDLPDAEDLLEDLEQYLQRLSDEDDF